MPIVYQSSVRRKRVTAIVMASSINANSAIVLGSARWPTEPIFR